MSFPSVWISSTFFPSKHQTAGMERIKPDYEWGEPMSLFIERMWRTAHFCKAVYVIADSTVPHESPVTASHRSSHCAASDISICYMKTICSGFLLFTTQRITTC